MKVVGETAESLVHKSNRQSSFVHWMKAEYCIVPCLVHVPYLVVGEVTWGWFGQSLGLEGFRSQVSNDTIHASKTDHSNIPIPFAHNQSLKYTIFRMTQSAEVVANPQKEFLHPSHPLGSPKYPKDRCSLL